MKLLQLNAWGGKLGQQILTLIKEQSPDFVCLQEIIGVPGDPMGFFISLDQLRAELDYEYVFLSPVFSFNYMNKTARFGNAILSKFPIEKQETVFTRFQHKENFDFDTDDYNIRNFQHSIIDINNGLNILNHHGHHVHSHKMGDEESFRQCKLIADYISGLKGPIILAGDFNLTPRSKPLEQLNKALNNLSLKYNIQTTRSQLTHKNEVCDYIFVSDGVKIKNFQVLDELVSDHKALLLEFDL